MGGGASDRDRRPLLQRDGPAWTVMNPSPQ